MVESLRGRRRCGGGLGGQGRRAKERRRAGERRRRRQRRQAATSDEAFARPPLPMQALDHKQTHTRKYLRHTHTLQAPSARARAVHAAALTTEGRGDTHTRKPDRPSLQVTPARMPSTLRTRAPLTQRTTTTTTTAPAGPLRAAGFCRRPLLPFAAVANAAPRSAAAASRRHHHPQEATTRRRPTLTTTTMASPPQPLPRPHPHPSASASDS